MRRSPVSLDSLNELVEMAVQAPARQALSDVVSSFARSIGFDRFALAKNIQDPTWVGIPDLTNWPSEFVSAYVDTGAHAFDPTIAGIRKGDAIAAWSIHHLQRASALHALTVVMRQVGVRSGIVIAMPQALFPGAILSLTSGGKTKAPKAAVEAARLVGQVGLVRLAHLDGPSVMGRRLRELTPRQLTVLTWAAHGKSNRDIAVITGLSERTVVHHMSEVLRKLGCSTRTQAVARLIGTSVRRPMADNLHTR